MFKVKQNPVLRAQGVFLILVPLVWAALVALPMSFLLHAVISLPFLLFIPGIYLYLLLSNTKSAKITAEMVAYSLGLSLLFLTVLGFSINELGLLFSYNTPLTFLPLLISTAVIISLVGVALGFRNIELIKPKINLNKLSLGIGGLLLPIGAIAGANTLNNGGSNIIATIVIFLAAALIVTISWYNRRHTSSYPYVLYIVGLTILLGTSMRGWNITGHDVMQEFQVFQLTSLSSVWHMHYYQDAYNACMSITILPTVLQRLSGIPDLYIFKFVFQLYFAAMAPILYLSLRKYVPVTMAFLAGALFITFPTFLMDMAMLNRQETAFIFLGLAILAALDATISRRLKWTLALLFFWGMVLSHYSTSYITVAILLISALITLVIKVTRKYIKKFKMSSEITNPLFSATLVISTALILIGWNTLATQTSNNVLTTVTGIFSSVPKLLNLQISSAPKAKLTSADEVNQYASTIVNERSLPQTSYYNIDIIPGLSISPGKDSIDNLTTFGKSLRIPKTTLYKIFDTAKSLYAKLIQVLILLGVGLMVLSKKVRTRLPFGYVVFGCSSLIILGMQVILPPTVINYGLLRLIQQSLLVLSFPVIAAGYWLLARLRVPLKVHHRIISVMIGLFFLILSGALPALTGGYKPALPLSNSGFYYEAYYTHQDEIMADQWLAEHTPTGSRVFSDEFARRQMITYAGIFSTASLVPGSIPIDSYVYLSDTNNQFGIVPAYSQGNLIFYNVPTNFIQSNKNLIYSTGSVKIYR